MASQETEDSQNPDLLYKELTLSSLVHEVTRVMHSAATLDQAMQAFLLGAAELTGAERMALLTFKDGEARLTPAHDLGLSPEVKAILQAAPSVGPVKEVLISQRHLLVEEVLPGDPFLPTGTERYLLLPLTTRIAEIEPGGPSCMLPVGVLWLDATLPGPELTGQSISHLSALSQQASLMLETWRAQRELASANVELKQANLKLNEAYAALSQAQKIIEKDLDRARSIQNNLLPAAFPEHLLKRVASRYIPAGMVGGDYYDCFELPGNRLGVVVADVSGHGIGAALVMSMFKALLRSFSENDPSPCSVLNRINATFMTQSLGAAQFVTAYYGIFDKAVRSYVYCNAGHVAQLLRHESPIESRAELLEMPSQGLVLGMFDNTFLTDAVLLLPGDARLFLFTDGITEAHGTTGKMFGVEPVKQLAMDSAAESPAGVVDALMRARCDFLGGSIQATGELADDATLVIIDL
ncbi:MAG: PP2C family protein-serine/threonine phosphatase [Fibrobacteres bacterium]|jgi:serine phosphatase RsbU (regulator of sigma subunit)|nr:PP2C family protein-serine/threonine phosphatase [Fibrobacterota bacterium]